MNYSTIKTNPTSSSFDVVKITERENSGVRSLSLARIAVGYVVSGAKYRSEEHTSELQSL